MIDAYLMIEGVPGETTSAGWEEHIEIVSYAHSLNQPTVAAVSDAGGQTHGRCEHGDFSIVKQLDKASPILAEKCSAGESIPSVTLTLCRAGNPAVPYMVYKLEKVVVASIAPAGAGDEVPAESVSFNYVKISWTYTQVDKSGVSGGSTEGSWNLETNAKT